MSRRIKVSPQPSQLLHLLIRGGQALQWHALQQRSTVRYEYAGDAGSESETLAAALRSCLLATHHPARRADGALGQERTGCEELEATSEVVKRCVAPGALCSSVWRIAAAQQATTQLANGRRARGRGRRRPGLARRQRGKRRLRRSMRRGQGSPCSLLHTARRTNTLEAKAILHCSTPGAYSLFRYSARGQCKGAATAASALACARNA
jgi:hypothetical protein